MGTGLMDRFGRVLAVVMLAFSIGCVSCIQVSLAYADEGHVTGAQAAVSDNGIVSAGMEIVVEVVADPEVVTVPKTSVKPVSAAASKGSLPQTGDIAPFAQLMVLAGMAMAACGAAMVTRSRRQGWWYR